jgi:hypothetical protein
VAGEALNRESLAGAIFHSSASRTVCRVTRRTSSEEGCGEAGAAMAVDASNKVSGGAPMPTSGGRSQISYCPCLVILDWRCDAFWSNGAAVSRSKLALPEGSSQPGLHGAAGRMRRNSVGVGALVKRAYFSSGGRPWPTGTMRDSIVNSIGSKRNFPSPLRVLSAGSGGPRPGGFASRRGSSSSSEVSSVSCLSWGCGWSRSALCCSRRTFPS